MPATAALAPPCNADYNWDLFDPARYHAHNYAALRPDDARILGIVRDWFATAAPAGERLRGIDVGTGSNLGPAFALLPYCNDVTLYEHGTANVEWLERQLKDPGESWAPFALQASGIAWRQARHGLPKVARVQQGSIFDLPKRQWRIGAMAFVAESLTADFDEFERALARFLGALKPNSPFAAAFMAGSEGYSVGGVHYPAVSLTGPMLGAALTRCGAVDGFIVHRVDIDPAPIRAGYTGYLVATGRSRGVA